MLKERVDETPITRTDFSAIPGYYPPALDDEVSTENYDSEDIYVSQADLPKLPPLEFAAEAIYHIKAPHMLAPSRNEQGTSCAHSLGSLIEHGLAPVEPTSKFEHGTVAIDPTVALSLRKSATVVVHNPAVTTSSSCLPCITHPSMQPAASARIKARWSILATAVKKAALVASTASTATGIVCRYK